MKNQQQPLEALKEIYGIAVDKIFPRNRTMLGGGQPEHKVQERVVKIESFLENQIQVFQRFSFDVGKNFTLKDIERKEKELSSETLGQLSLIYRSSHADKTLWVKTAIELVYGKQPLAIVRHLSPDRENESAAVLVIFLEDGAPAEIVNLMQLHKMASEKSTVNLMRLHKVASEKSA